MPRIEVVIKGGGVLKSVIEKSKQDACNEIMDMYENGKITEAELPNVVCHIAIHVRRFLFIEWCCVEKSIYIEHNESSTAPDNTKTGTHADVK